MENPLIANGEKLNFSFKDFLKNIGIDDDVTIHHVSNDGLNIAVVSANVNLGDSGYFRFHSMFIVTGIEFHNNSLKIFVSCENLSITDNYSMIAFEFRAYYEDSNV